MTRLSKAGFDAAMARLIRTNTTQAITGDILQGVIQDLSDSVDYLPSSALVPVITSLEIDGQALRLPSGTQISGSRTFNYAVAHEDNVSGNLTLAQDGANLATNLDPKAFSTVQTINSVTLADDQQVDFVLSGTDGVTPFSRTVSITGVGADRTQYLGFMTSSNAADVSSNLTGAATSVELPFFPLQLTIPTFSGNQRLFFAQRASDNPTPVPPSEFIIDRVDQFGAFTQFSAATTIGGELFNVWLSNRAVDGAELSGEVFRILR